MLQDDVPASGRALELLGELPASSRAPDQLWFSMIMVNDPNAALFGALRPSRPHPILAAIRRPFERDALPEPQPVSVPSERVPAPRPRWSRWLAVGLLVLGVGGVEAALEVATSNETPQAASAAVARVGSTTLDVTTPEQPAPSAEPMAHAPMLTSSREASAGGTTRAAAITAPAGLVDAARATSPIAVSTAPRAAEPTAAPAAASARASRPARASATATTSVKKKPNLRQRKRAFERAFAKSSNTRR